MPESKFSFNLIEEPWIPCVWRDGRRQEAGLRTALLEAHEIAEITGDNPPTLAALFRLLLAIVHRCSGQPAGPRTIEDWRRLRDAGSFAAAPINTYLDRWRDSFDLFDPEKPFYQVAGMPKERAGTVIRLRQMGDGYPTLFEHQLSTQLPAITPELAARQLVMVQAFDLGGIKTSNNAQGKESADAAPLVQSAVCIARGPSLFDTLMLNLHGYDPKSLHLPFSFDPNLDRPAWERTAPTEARDRAPDGYLDLLTWQSRRVLLFPERGEAGEQAVRLVALFKGYQFPDSFNLDGAETMVPYKRVLKPAAGQKPFVPLRLSEEKALWRDSTALLESVDESYTRPRTLSWLASLSEAGVDLPSALPVDVIGFAADKSKPLFWRHESLTVPREYLQQHLLVRALRGALKSAEDAARLLDWRLIDVPLPNKPKPVPFSSPLMVLAMDLAADRDTQKKIAEHISPQAGYWRRLEQAFQLLLQRLPADRQVNATGDVSYGGEALPRWRDVVRGAVESAFGEATASFESSGKGQRSAAMAADRLSFLLRTVLPRELATAALTLEGGTE
jgi:CRISPR system Cascade subunit CasA